MRPSARLAVSLAVIALSVCAAGFAVAARASSNANSGVLNLAVANSDVDYSDPTLAYGVLSWQIEYVTCAKLVNYPDASGTRGSELVPDAATGFPVVSNNGKTYTFTIRNGLKFSNGDPVTAESFAYQINRDANPKMSSSAVPFVGDIVGLNAVVHGKAKTVSGVVANGQKLTIHLTQRDGGLLSKLAMPFFCAVDPPATPVDPHGLLTLPGAGPYYIASRTAGKQIVLKRNPYYTGHRPHRSQTIVITMNLDAQQTFLQVSNGTYAADPTGLDSPASAASLAKKYGVNKTRFWIEPTLSTFYVALNMARPTFANEALRKAANAIVDRPAMVRVGGFGWGRATDTILPAGLSGGVWGAKIFPINRADPALAKKYQGGASCGSISLWYQVSPIQTPQAGIVRAALSELGCKVTLRPFQGYAIYTAAGVKGANFDATFASWYADYPDAYDFFHLLLDGRTIHATSNVNVSYTNVPALNKRIDEASALSGRARVKAFGQVDLFTTKNVVPWISYANATQRDFLGPNVGGYVFEPSYGSMNLATLYIK